MTPFDAEPQAVLGLAQRAALFLTLTVAPGHEAEAVESLGEMPGLTHAVDFRAPRDELSCVVGIGAEFWDRAFDAPRPDGLHRFVALDSGVHQAPSTPGDLFFHIRATHRDLVFELGRRILREFGDAVAVADSTEAFRYYDSRDLLGFVDGTENPSGRLARTSVLTGNDTAYPGSSHVIVQKYVHDLDAWGALPVPEQEATIGRSKQDDIEIPNDQKAIDSHVLLNTITDPDGTERKILRDNLPFGSIQDGTYGTYFIGYAADVGVTEQMLRNMFLGTSEHPGIHDRILDVSQAVTGNLFFVPSVDFLTDPDGAIARAHDWHRDHEKSSQGAPAPTTASPTAPSLGIGGLRATQPATTQPAANQASQTHQN